MPPFSRPRHEKQTRSFVASLQLLMQRCPEAETKPIATLLSPVRVRYLPYAIGGMIVPGPSESPRAHSPLKNVSACLGVMKCFGDTARIR
jgi:hypothetical protein